MAFRVPAYRWMWSSSFLAANGFISFMLAQGWLMLELTNSPLMVGLAPGLGGVAQMVASPIGGVLADRVSRRTMLVITQAATASAILVLGLLTIIDLVHVWHILVASIFHGLNRGLQGPARASLMYDLVGRRAVMNAMAGQFLAFHGASAIGPLGAGFLMASFGTGPVFLGVSAFLFVSALLLLPLPRLPRTLRRPDSFWQNLTEGVRFTLHDRAIRTVMWTILFTESLGFSSRSMFPVVARDLFDAGPIVLGLFSTFWGIGGIVTGITLSGLARIRSKGWVFMGAAFGFGLLLLLFSFSRSLPLSLALLLLAGGFGFTYDTMASTLIQTLAPEAMRGRVMGLYGILLSGFSIGALLMGAVANVLGVTTAIASGGAAVSVNALRVAPAARLIEDRSSAGLEVSPATDQP